MPGLHTEDDKVHRNVNRLVGLVHGLAIGYISCTLASSSLAAWSQSEVLSCVQVVGLPSLSRWRADLLVFATEGKFDNLILIYVCMCRSLVHSPTVLHVGTGSIG
jgi:hypothetical protein